MIGSASGINAFQQILGMQNASTSNRATTPLGNINPLSGGVDQFMLSATSNMMQQLLNTDIQEGQRGEIDLGSLEQLKQRGDLLANMLQSKLKSFESNLIAGMKSAGLDSTQAMDLKDGSNGLTLLNELPNKDDFQKFFRENGALKDQFQEIARLADLVGMLQQIGNYAGSLQKTSSVVSNPAAQYAQQSHPNTPAPEKRSGAEFVLRVMQGNASYTFQ